MVSVRICFYVLYVPYTPKYTKVHEVHKTYAQQNQIKIMYHDCTLTERMKILDESLIYVLSDISTKLETIGDNLERIAEALEALADK